MSATQQKALSVAEKGAPFEVITRSVPTPGPGFVLVKIHSAALNPVDNYVRLYGIFAEEWPIVPGTDGAGTVEAVGEGVTDLQKGDRVLYQAIWTSDRGTFQQYGLADATRIAKIPDNVSFDEAATFPLGLATAAMGFYGKKSKSARSGAELVAPWEAGGRGKYSGPIVVAGGSSSVGQFAIQLAKLSGFSPIITTASARNEAYCKAAGATHVIDYKSVPYSALPDAVAKITSEPVTLVYDAIASDDSQKAGWQILAPKGHMIVTLTPVVGTPGAEAEEGKQIVWVFGNVHNAENREVGLAMYRSLTGWLADGTLKPNAFEVVPSGLAGIPAALERILGGKVSAVKLVAHPQEA